MFDPSDINEFHNVLPTDVNNLLHKTVLSYPKWTIVTDNLPINIFQMVNGGSDAGMILCSYRNKNSNSILVESEYKRIDENGDVGELNFYADMIHKLVLDKCIKSDGICSINAFTNIQVVRYFWNYYHDSSIGIEHTDIDEENHWSIIYYLNTVPGKGTRIFKPNTTEEILIPHIAGNAVLFPSTWVHAGTSANKNTHRSCLNILFKATLN
jgi:hypothetical protein